MSSSRGIFYLVLSYVFWGFSPFFWKLLGHVSPFEVMIHRALWSCLCLVPFALQPKGRSEIRALIGPRRKDIIWLIATAILIIYNWYNFVTAMVTGQVLQSSLAYALNPLMNIILGLVLLHEPMNRWQWFSVVVAFVSVGILVVGSGQIPGLALILAATFSFYGFVRKKMALSGTTAIFLETLLAAPFLLFVLFQICDFNHSLGTWLLLIATGPVTALPLIWYVWGVQAVPFTTAGFLQFMLPVIQFLLAVCWFHEEFGIVRQVAFGLMGIALAIFCTNLLFGKVRGNRKKSTR